MAIQIVLVHHAPLDHQPRSIPGEKHGGIKRLPVEIRTAVAGTLGKSRQTAVLPDGKAHHIRSGHTSSIAILPPAKEEIAGRREVDVAIPVVVVRIG